MVHSVVSLSCRVVVDSCPVFVVSLWVFCRVLVVSLSCRVVVGPLPVLVMSLARVFFLFKDVIKSLRSSL